MPGTASNLQRHETVVVSDMKAAFEQTFGSGSAAISIECDKDASRTLIGGISIN